MGFYGMYGFLWAYMGFYEDIWGSMGYMGAVGMWGCVAVGWRAPSRCPSDPIGDLSSSGQRLSSGRGIWGAGWGHSVGSHCGVMGWGHTMGSRDHGIGSRCKVMG